MPFINANQVRELTTLSKSSVDRMEANGRFPQRIKVGERSVAWDLQEVTEWMANLKRVALKVKP